VQRVQRARSRTGRRVLFLYRPAPRAARHAPLAARQGKYANKVTDLDIRMTAPKYFKIAAPKAGPTKSIQTSWQMTLTRQGASAGYGAYTVTFNHDGYNAANSTISKKPAINPMQT